MIYRSLFVPLGVDSTPLGLRKQIAPAVPIVAAAGAAFLGSLINSSSQAGANETNLQMVRETNEANKQMAADANRMSQVQFDRNMDWLRAQYYDTEQYKRTVEALQKAGLNPALALGNASPVGSVGAPSQSSFHTAQMEAGHVEPVRYGDALSESVGSATNAYFQNQLLNEQAENIGEDTQTKRINNATQAQRNMLEIHNLYEEVQNRLSQRGLSDEQKNYYSKLKEQLSRQIDLFNATYDDLVKREGKENKILDANAENIESQTALNKINAMFLPALHRANINLSNSQARSLVANLETIAPQIALLASERKLNDSKNVAQILMNGFDALDYKDKAQLAEIYGKNGFTQKGKNFFYALGDLIMHGLNNVKVPR